MEDSLENLDLPPRIDEGKRKKSEIKIKMWKNYLGIGRDWIREVLKVKLVTWPLMPNLSRNGRVWLGGGYSYGLRGPYFDLVTKYSDGSCPHVQDTRS